MVARWRGQAHETNAQVHMQTYKDATVYPGPRLNVVLGPNGAFSCFLRFFSYMQCPWWGLERCLGFHLETNHECSMD